MSAPLVLVEGFESQSAELFLSASGSGTPVWNTGRFGGKAFNTTSSGLVCALPLMGSGEEISLGYSIKRISGSQLQSYCFVDISGGNQYLLGLSGDTVLFAKNTSSATSNPLSVGLVQNVWATVELRFISGASGYVEVRINGTQAFTYTGTTVKTSYSGIAQIHFEWSSNQLFDLDDLWVERGTGAGFRGDRKVISLAPTGDSAAGWASTTGANHWSQVSEIPAVTTSYVATPALTGAADTFTFADLPAGTTTVEAVAVSAIANKTDVGAGKLALARGGTAGTAQTITDSGSAWQRVQEVFATDGAAAAWTPTSVNSSTFGIVASA